MFFRYPSKTGNELPDSPLGQVSDSNELLTSNIEKEKINQLSIDYFADLQRLYKSPEKAQEIVKLFKEIHQRVDFNHEHFTVLLQSMEHYEQIGDAQHVDIIADIIEIAYGLLDKARSRILLYDGLKDRLVKDVVAVMNMFKHHAAIQKYGVNIFSLFGPSAILDQIFSVAKVVMQSLDVLHERDSEAKVVEMMTNFPREVSREENAVLGSRANMKNFLRILEQELQSPHKPLLSPIIGALTSLTDETPMSGINLVNENGLDVFDRLLQDKDVSIEVKIDTLMVVSNLAEVSYTQREIIKHRTIVVILQFFLVSRNSRMSFVSANALAHLSDVSETEWTQLSGVNEFRKNTLQKLYEEVQNWESLVAPMNIKFRSFKPLYRLLEKFDSPATQLYAAWTIRYFCLLDEKTYKEILLKEDGFNILTSINSNDLTDSKVRKILRDIILIVQ